MVLRPLGVSRQVPAGTAAGRTPSAIHPSTYTETDRSESEMRPEPAKVLVVATRTAACAELIDQLKRRNAESAASFTLLVPATPYGWAWLADMYSGGIDAERYLASAVERYQEAGIDLTAPP